MACLFILLANSGQSVASATEYEQVPGLMDARSTFSDRAYEMEDVARMASERGFGVLIINDHDRITMEFGTPPLRNITKKKLELGSINFISGPARFPGKILRHTSTNGKSSPWGWMIRKVMKHFPSCTTAPQ